MVSRNEQSTPEEQEVQSPPTEDTGVRDLKDMSDEALEALATETVETPEEPSKDTSGFEQVLKREVGQLHNRMSKFEQRLVEPRVSPAQPTPPVAFSEDDSPAVRSMAQQVANLNAQIAQERRERQMADANTKRREAAELSFREEVLEDAKLWAVSPEKVDWAEDETDFRERRRRIQNSIKAAAENKVEEKGDVARQKAKDIQAEVARREALRSAETSPTGGAGADRKIYSVEEMAKLPKEEFAKVMEDFRKARKEDRVR